MSSKKLYLLEIQPTTLRSTGYFDEPAEPTTSHGTGYSDDPAFDHLVNTLSSQLSKLGSTASHLQSQLVLVHTQKDPKIIRGSVKTADSKSYDHIKIMLDQTGEGFKQVTEVLEGIYLWKNVSPSQRSSQKKLSRQHEDIHESIKAAYLLFDEKILKEI